MRSCQPDDQARAHGGLALAFHALGRREEARDHWQQALSLLTAHGVEETADAEVTATAIRAALAI